MKQFDFQAELKKIIDAKQLVEIFLHGAPTYKVAYLLNANNDYLTFAEVSSSALFSGVIICNLSDVDWIGVETPYLGELAKQIVDDSVYKQATEDIKNIKEFSFKGFVSAFVDTKRIVEITDEDETVTAGRVLNQDDKVLVFDEYSAENTRKLARMFFNKNSIIRIAIDVPWLRTIERFLEDKNIQ